MLPISDGDSLAARCGATGYMGALFGVIGIGWLVVVPMYRGWKHLHREMSERILKSSRMLAEHSRLHRCSLDQPGAGDRRSDATR